MALHHKAPQLTHNHPTTTSHNQSNRFVHLANNSVQYHSKEFQQSPIPGNMWHSDTFRKHLRERTVRQ